MKFSILLPTRNRLEYLQLAVESVRRQDFSDWQLVISDNRSEQDIEGYVASLADRRIVYQRTERAVAVTENWNRALAFSDGDYVIMLGDDDALLGGYLRRMDELISEFDEPEVIYTKALLFTYPGVDPEHPTGYLVDHGCAEFFAGASQPFVLERPRALEAVRATMQFRMRFDFNAQFALISRRLIDTLGAYGDFYQSDFPDYYSMNAAFLRAERIVIDPHPRVIIGVTPKSYGYFHVNHKEGEGRAFLGGAAAPSASGSNINIGWLSAAETLERGVGREADLRVDRRRYRFVQSAHMHERHRAGALDRQELRAFEGELPLLERWSYRAASAALACIHGVLPARLWTTTIGLANRLIGQLPAIDPTIVEGRYGDVLEICKGRDEDSLARPTHSLAGD
jgi:glycosyltransferase involved in cell wall biosynthesis